MENFELPTNIKQIGSIDGAVRIYVEDYVFTYVQQYALAGGNNERLAVLVGRNEIIDGQAVLFISGAIEGKYCLEERGSLEFTQRSHEYFLDMCDKYFPDLEIVGWVQSQPGYGTYLGSRYYNYHIENFTKDYQVLFVTDPIQRLNTFYAYDNTKSLTEMKGYFVYYDKNKPMHEYMTDNKSSSYKMQEKPEESAEDESDSTEDKSRKVRVSSKSVDLRGSARIGSDSEIDIKRRQLVRQRRGVNENKRLVNMLSGLCAVLLFSCFVLGAGLIKSDDRINILEQNIASLNTAYRDIVSNGQSQAAFAPSSTETVQGENPKAVVLVENGNELLDAENAKAAENAQAAQVSSNTSEAVTTVQVPPAEAVSSLNIPETYTVQQGDSLIGISQKIYGTKDMVDEIMEVNNITDPDKIFFGKVLIMPKK